MMQFLIIFGIVRLNYILNNIMILEKILLIGIEEII